MSMKVTALIGGASIMLASVALPAGLPADACALLTPARVSEALGVMVGAGQHILASNPQMCGWTTSAGTAGKRLMLDVLRPIGTLSPEQRFATGKTPVPKITKTPVSGIGDDAYFTVTPGLGTGLSVRKGSAVFQIRVYGFPDERARMLEETLAREVVAKL